MGAWTPPPRNWDHAASVRNAMAQLPVDERGEHILKLDLATRMKALGFRKRTKTFWREIQTKEPKPTKAVQLCEIRVGGSSSSFEGILTGQLAVYYPEFVPLLTPWQTVLPSPIKQTDGHVKAPLGLLRPEKDPQQAWRIDENANDETIAKELAEAIDALGIPYLDAALDMEKVATLAIPGVDPFLEVLALQRLGRKDAAKAKVAALLALRPKEYMAIASFAGRLKLPVPPRPAVK
jgi:hypothetical protein